MSFPKSLLVVLFATCSLWSTAQKVQIIHNAADPALDTVDIYVNGLKTLDDVAFRDNSGFITLPTIGQVSIGIKDNNAASADADLLTIPYTPTTGKTEILVASGVVTKTDFEANPDGEDIGATVFTISNAKTMADDNTKVAFNVLHGSTDAPTIDIVIRGTSLAFDDVKYGDASPYLEVTPGKYIIDVYESTRTTVVTTFEADLSGLAGSALTAYASGFFDPSKNQMGPAFGLIAAVQPAMAASRQAGVAQKALTTAKVQIIHNAADPAAKEVDIWLNGQAVSALDNFAFRTATGFIDLPANSNIKIGVAPGTSTKYEDTLATFDFNLLAGETYQVIANGVLDPSKFAANPDSKPTAFGLWANAASTMNSDNTKLGVRVIHGATDAPTVDVQVRGANLTLVDDADYGAITEYLNVDPANYRLDIADGTGTTVVATFDADLMGTGGAVATVLASGFLDPAMNNGGEAFALIGVLADGTIVTPTAVTTAKVQVIHNAADPAADSVDVYLNGMAVSALADFKFRTASPYVDLPANQNIMIGIAPGNSSDYSDTLKTFSFRLLAGETYGVIANGVVGTGFEANPDAKSTDFTLWATSARTMAEQMGKVEFKVVHGSTDAPTVDVEVDGGPKLVDNASYGDFTDYIAVDPNAYVLDVKDEMGTTTVASFNADLNGLGGNTAFVLASGFYDGTNANQQSNAFGLYAVLPTGGAFVPFGLKVSDERILITSSSSVFPNPVSNVLNVSSEEEIISYRILGFNGQLYDAQILNGGRNLNIETNSLSDGVYMLTLTTESGVSQHKITVSH